MKFNKYIVATVLSSLGFVKANYFEGIQRDEFFEKIELNMPTIRINLSDEAYNNFKLTFQCLYDTHPSYESFNEDCYKAPWVNYNEIMNSLVQNGVIDNTKLTFEQQNQLTNPELNYDDFSSIISVASSLSLPTIFSQRQSYVFIPSYEEKKASIDFILNGEITTKEKVKFSVGGKYTQVFEKPQFNIQIKNGDLFGKKNLRLRSEVIDPSFLRSKIGCDLTDILDLPSVEASYTKVLINNDDMGLYLVRDTFKSDWIETNFGEVNTTSLYECDAEYGSSFYFNCINEDSKEADAQYTNFIQSLETAQSEEELSQFFDVDLYIKWQAYKYLTGSWDHVTTQHNQYLYNNKGKWINLLYDFDSDFGAYKTPNPAQTFSEFSNEMELPLYQLLGLNENNQKLIDAIKEIVMTAFNPVKLFPRIDELMDYLQPYILEDRTPENDSVSRPGHLLRPAYKIENGFTMQDYLNNAGFHNYYLRKYYTSVDYDLDEIYGVKRWIIEKFRFVCTQYQIDCSFASEYLEGGNFQLPSTESTDVILEEHQKGCKQSGFPCCLDLNGGIISVDGAGEWNIEGSIWCLYDRPVGGQQQQQQQDNSIDNNNMMPSMAVSSAIAECWAQEQGFPCCREATEVLYSENGNNWSMENGEWCGIINSPQGLSNPGVPPVRIPDDIPMPNHGYNRHRDTNN
ncbi:hypothetical protein BCR36DRAFT_416132 [Piromyces finnis]|uniref:CBM10 domain-containing protein n=1 Tax=Piromyces finnis TaxID=1754191 RepID=A0A1Y1UWL9_9FUNG|nr:hypothetical protein BCR36DRAFT_416132 [Piromyces finnis]|eukprot:ORX42385.1 hypothetical protein BCR36DRAFT_416132 [Piromyces finnis]